MVTERKWKKNYSSIFRPHNGDHVHIYPLLYMWIPESTIWFLNIYLNVILLFSPLYTSTQRTSFFLGTAHSQWLRHTTWADYQIPIKSSKLVCRVLRKMPVLWCGNSGCRVIGIIVKELISSPAPHPEQPNAQSQLWVKILWHYSNTNEQQQIK